jgi:hypothetical protein
MMRGSFRWIGLAATLLTLANSPSRAANPLDDLIEPVAGKSACFTRVYDVAHLKAHPKQKTTAMTVWLKYETVGDSNPATVLAMSLAIIQRGDPAAMYSQGGCEWNEQANRDTSNNRLIKTYPKEAGNVCMQSARPDVFEAVSAQEGGSLIINRGKDRDTLMVYLDDELIMVKRANRGKLIGLRFGADDRVFLLRRTDMKECAAVEDAVTTPEPGVARQQR